MNHYGDVIMGAIASQITSLAIVYSTVYSDADQRKHQSSASLAFVRGIHRGPVNSPHKRPVMRKMLPFDDVIMQPSNVRPAHVLDLKLITAVPADARTPSGAKPSTGAVLTSQLDLIFSTVIQILMILNTFSLIWWRHSKWRMISHKISQYLS